MNGIEEIAEKVIAKARERLPVLSVEDPMLDGYQGGRTEEWASDLGERLFDFIRRCIDEHVPTDPPFPSKVKLTREWALGILNSTPELLNDRFSGMGNDSLAQQVATKVHFDLLELVMPEARRIAEELGFDLTEETPDPYRPR